MSNPFIRKLIGWWGHLGFGNRNWSAMTATPASSNEHNAFAAKMGPVLEEFETVRHSTYAQAETRVTYLLPLGLAVGIAAAIASALYELDFNPFMIVLLPVLGAMHLATSGPAASYRAAFKSTVIPHFFARFGLDGYTTSPKIDVAPLKDSGLFASNLTYKLEDEFSGNYRGHTVALAEVEISEETKDGERTIFEGLIMEFELPREVTGQTIIYPADWSDAWRTASRFEKFFSRQSQALAPVTLESPDFTKRYVVMSNDQVGARVLLSPTFMERVLKLNAGISSRQVAGMSNWQKRALNAAVGVARNSEAGRIAKLSNATSITALMNKARQDTNSGSSVIAVADKGRLLIAVPKAENIDYFEPPPYHVIVDAETVMMQMSVDIQEALNMADAIFDLDYRTRHAPSGLRLIQDVQAA
jgi:hypothetical protein